MSVLARLGGGHLDNLAGVALDDHEPILAQGGALGRVSFGGPRITTFKVLFSHTRNRPESGTVTQRRANQTRRTCSISTLNL